MSEYFPKPKSFRGRMKIGLNLSNYATETGFKNERGVDTSKSAKKVDLPTLKSECDKLDSDKIEKVSTGLNTWKVR